MITFDRLNSLLRYELETGVIYWKCDRGNSRLEGKIAGGLTSRGYRHIKVDGKQYQAHRLAWFLYYGEWPSEQIDHENHIKSDNRIKNLRVVSQQINSQNANLSSNNTSGVLGVYWYTACRKWSAQININREKIYLGSFDEWWDAVCARKAAENKYNFHPNHGKNLACSRAKGWNE